MTDELMDERAYSADDRARMAKSGEAMADGSYPIANKADLQNAIHAVGRGNGDHNAIRKHIMRRAKALGAMDMIPSNWMADGSMGGSNSRSELLVGTRELRRFTEFEVRDGAADGVTFQGYAALFDNPYSVTDRFGTFTEIISRSAFDRTLNSKPDVVLNVDHGGLPLARTKNGSLRLATDARGLHVDATLNPEIGMVRDIVGLVKDGNLSEMSFAFRCVRDDWNDQETERSLHEVAIDGGDVSIVTRGANRNTTANIRSAIDALKDFDRVLIEARGSEGLDLAELREVHETVGRVLTEMSPAPKATMSVKAALLELMAAS